MKLGITLKAVWSAIIFGLGTTAVLAEYPERPITMVVAFGAGGGTDVTARAIVPFIEKHLGGKVVIKNVPGAGGEIGFTELAHSKPDGYTVGFINTPHILAIPIQRNANYTINDVTPIGNIIYDPSAFSTQSNNPNYSDLQGLIDYAKKHPGKVTYGTTGVGSDDHIAGMLFSRAAGVTMTHVPFSGTADARAATLGGHINLGILNVTETIANVRAGDFKMLGQMGADRWTGAKDIPTFAEQGVKITMGSHRGIAAPSGIPKNILAKLEAALAAAIADPEFAEVVKKQNLAIDYQDSAAYSKTLNELNNNLEELWATSPWSK